MARGVHEMVGKPSATVEPISVQAAKQEIDEGTAAWSWTCASRTSSSRATCRGRSTSRGGCSSCAPTPSRRRATPRLTADRDSRIIVYCLKAPGARCVLAAETLGEWAIRTSSRCRAASRSGEPRDSTGPPSRRPRNRSGGRSMTPRATVSIVHPRRARLVEEDRGGRARRGRRARRPGRGGGAARASARRWRS